MQSEGQNCSTFRRRCNLSSRNCGEGRSVVRKREKQDPVSDLRVVARFQVSRVSFYGHEPRPIKKKENPCSIPFRIRLATPGGGKVSVGLTKTIVEYLRHFAKTSRVSFITKFVAESLQRSRKVKISRSTRSSSVTCAWKIFQNDGNETISLEYEICAICTKISLNDEFDKINLISI